MHAVMRDAHPSSLSVTEVHTRAQQSAGVALPESSVRSSLRLRRDDYEQVRRGYYKLRNVSG